MAIVSVLSSKSYENLDNRRKCKKYHWLTGIYETKMSKKIKWILAQTGKTDIFLWFILIHTDFSKGIIKSNTRNSFCKVSRIAGRKWGKNYDKAVAHALLQ